MKPTKYASLIYKKCETRIWRDGGGWVLDGKEMGEKGEVEGSVGDDGTPALWLAVSQAASTTIRCNKLKNRSNTNRAIDARSTA